MSVVPLYNDKDELFKSIKMSGATEEETLRQIDDAISTVRLNIFDAITAERALLIAGYASNQNPTTANEVLRRQAELLEVDWVMYELMPVLPMTYMAGGAKTNYQYNDETLTREQDAIKDFRDSLYKRIQKAIGKLVAPEQVVSDVKVASIGPDEDYLIDDHFPGLGFENLNRNTHVS